MIALGVGLGILLTRKWKLGWYVWWIGAAALVVSQVGHIPFNWFLTQLFMRGVLPAPPEEWQLLFNSVVLGLSAGLWEQGANYFAFRFWAREARSWRQAILLGAGHGGIEAMLLGGLSLYGFLQALALRDPSAYAAMPPEQAALVKQGITAYWSVAWWMPFIAVAERVFAMTMHIAAALLVGQAFMRRQTGWLFLAIGLHALMDGVAAYSGTTRGILVTEGLLGVIAILCLGIIIALRRPEPERATAAAESLPIFLSPLALPEVQESVENLEKTRYN